VDDPIIRRTGSPTLPATVAWLGAHRPMARSIHLRRFEGGIKDIDDAGTPASSGDLQRA
jgi:hypothetical protein